MIVQVNTDNNIVGNEELESLVNDVLKDRLNQFTPRLSRVEVFIKDENSHKKGFKDKRCSIEARIEGMKPLAASHQASSVVLALEGAVVKLKHVLNHSLKKLSDQSRKKPGIALQSSYPGLEKE